MRGRLGRYRLVRCLAVGGMAEVYLAVAEGLSGFEKRLVVKRLLPQHARDGELLAMFLDEARLVAALKHPNIGEVYDVGAQEGEYFFAMEYIAGRDLRDLLAAGAGEPLPLPEALAIVMGVGEGLHHAHEQRDEGGHLLEIVHRDVSPSNVLVSAAGQVKLIDFGVAKWTAQRTETRHGVLKGKCAYMSPEQCRAEVLDRRSDVFSLGVLLYEVTTGGRPFEGGNDFEVMTAIVRGTVDPPSARWPDYPAALETIVMRALAHRREDRYATAQALARDLGAFAGVAGVVPSASGLAALLERRFGDEAAGGMAVPEGDGAPPPTAETSPVRPASTGLDRTATDHQAPATIQPLALVDSVGGTSHAMSARRIAMFAVLGLAGVTAVAVASPWLRRSAPVARLDAPSVPVETSTARPQPQVPALSVVSPPPPGPAPEASPRRVKAARKSPSPPPPPAAVPTPVPAPAMKVWDPDSPIPPPP